MTTPVVGIDLGTTNTVVGVVKEGHAAALADENNERLIPSVVSFHPNGGVLVGRIAKERRLVDASNTVYSIKRLIGRSWDSEEVRKARLRFPFEMREGPGQAALVVARGQSYTLPEISAFVLRRAKGVAEAALGGPVERAVITVPANFNDLQRAATKVAGRVAGLEVLRILNEPTAAALAYGYGRGATERLAVYDFGGGTFDVTLLDLSENVFEVLATSGNTFLGGDDIDLALAESMAREFLSRHKYDARTDGQAFERLRAAAEELKMKLSRDGEATIKIPEVAHGAGGRALDLEFHMTRGDLEKLLLPIVDKTFEVCREALGIARLSSGDFDQVLLVGGSTRIPLVRQRVEEFFKRPVLGHISPDEVVAIGAAIQASALTGAERRRDIPHPPQPAARTTDRGTNPNLSRGTNPQITKGGTLPPGALVPGGPTSMDPGTEPYGGRQRGRMPTNPGLHDSASRVLPPGAPGAHPKLVVPPTTAPHSAIPVTAEHGRPRPITRPGPSQVPVTEPPGTVSGLGPRGRVPTGTGLGPDAASAVGRGAVGTLTSAHEAAQKAMALSELGAKSREPPREPPGVVITADPDAEHSGVTLPKAPGAEDVTAEGAQVASFLARYTSSPAQPRRTGVEPQPPPPPPQEESVPAYRVSDHDINYDDSGLLQPVTAQPTTAELRQMAAPQSTDEVTEVHHRRTASRATGARIPIVDEAALPIPGLADDDKTYDGVTAPQGYQAVGGTEQMRQMPPPPPARQPFPSAPGSTGQVPTLRRNPLAPVSTMVSPPPGGPPLGDRGFGIPPTMGAPNTAPIQTAPMHAVPEPPVRNMQSIPNVLSPLHMPAAPLAAQELDTTPQWGAALGTQQIQQTPYVPAAGAGPRTPLLVDVTPLTLNVETVQGYCDAIIGRNTPVPCERSRTFVTAADNQTTVRVRVGQGESKFFRENTLLGEIELSGLRSAPRGQVKIEVAFSLDTDGILNVKATDVQTGHEARATLRLVAVPDAGQVSDLAARQAGIPLMS